MARKERYIVGLDVGTSKICCVVGEALDEGGIDIVGVGVAESRGIKRGVVVNVDAAVDSIKKAIDEGIIAGPRIFPSGAMITTSGGHGDLRLPFEGPARRVGRDGQRLGVRGGGSEQGDRDGDEMFAHGWA